MARFDAAEECIQQSCEYVSLPWVLLAKAEVASLDPAVGVDQAVAPLERAYGVAVEQGAHLYALRAAVGMAELPDEVRPTGWRERLVTARSRIPAASSYPDVVRADALLAPG